MAESDYETFQTLKLDHTKLEDFGNLAIEREGGGVDAIVALSTRLFFKGGETAAARNRAIDATSKYCVDFEDYISHFITHEGTPLEFDKAKALTYFRAQAGLDDPDERSLFLSVVGYPDGQPRRQPLEIECRISAAMPYWTQFEIFSEWAATNSFESLGASYHLTLLQKVIEWASIVQPGHGTAGPSLQLDNTANHQRPGATIFPLLARFPGLDYDDGGSWIANAGLNNRIRSINWLTVIDDQFVKTLGGLDKLRTELGANCPLHTYNGGVVIQAG